MIVLYSKLTATLRECSIAMYFINGKIRKKGSSVSRRRSSFIVTPYGDSHKSTLEYILPLLLLPLLLGRQGLLTAWVIYQYPLDSIFSHVRNHWSRSSPMLCEKLKQSIDKVETKFLSSSTANLLNQILFFTLADKCLALDKRTSLYTLIFYNFLAYSIQYLQELRTHGEETWASVSISSSTNIRHLAMSATKLVLEWTKLVTFLATLVTFLLVLQLDSSAFATNVFPPMKYTLLTLTYYLLMEEKIQLSHKVHRYTIITIDQIQGLEPLYLRVLQNGVTIFLNVLLIFPLVRSNPKLCFLTAYNNVYLQYKNIKFTQDAIAKEWERISHFRIPNEEEIKDLDDVCTVCLNSLQCQVRVTKCHHFFHANCLRLYLKESRYDSCPICKRTLTL